MRIIVFSLFCCIFTSSSFAQKKGNNFFRDPYGYYQSDHGGYDFTLGFYQANFKNLNNHMHQLGAKDDFGNYYFTAGLATIIPVGGRYGESNGLVALSVFIPKKVNVGDSLQFSLSGYQMTTSFLERDILPSEKFDFVVGIGASWGGAFYKEKRMDQIDRYDNLFFSPLARAEFRYVKKKLALGSRLTYRYDVTKSRWLSLYNDYPDIQGSKFSGIGFEIFIGLNLYPKPESQFAPPTE